MEPAKHLKKCKYCKQEIAEADLVQPQQLDIKRQPKFKLDKKSGKQVPVTFNAHRNCWEKKEKERISWENLYEYMRKKYFDKIVPSGTVVRLQDIRNGSSRTGRIINFKQGYSYDIILGCLKEYQGEIDKYTSGKSFSSETQKGNYIMTVIEKKIDSFAEEDKAKVIQLVESVETQKSNFDISKIQEQIYKRQEDDKEVENKYDFLD